MQCTSPQVWAGVMQTSSEIMTQLLSKHQRGFMDFMYADQGLPLTLLDFMCADECPTPNLTRILRLHSSLTYRTLMGLIYACQH